MAVVRAGDIAGGGLRTDAGSSQRDHLWGGRSAVGYSYRTALRSQRRGREGDDNAAGGVRPQGRAASIRLGEGTGDGNTRDGQSSGAWIGKGFSAGATGGVHHLVAEIQADDGGLRHCHREARQVYRLRAARYPVAVVGDGQGAGNCAGSRRECG